MPLVHHGHAGATYVVAGSERLTFADMAQQMAVCWGHPVAVRRLPSWLVASVGARRLGRASFPLMKAMLDHYDAAGFVGPDDDLRRLLEREPTPFVDVLRRRPARPFIG